MSYSIYILFRHRHTPRDEVDQVIDFLRGHRDIDITGDRGIDSWVLRNNNSSLWVDLAPNESEYFEAIGLDSAKFPFYLDLHTTAGRTPVNWGVQAILPLYLIALIDGVAIYDPQFTGFSPKPKKQIFHKMMDYQNYMENVLLNYQTRRSLAEAKIVKLDKNSRVVI